MIFIFMTVPFTGWTGRGGKDARAVTPSPLCLCFGLELCLRFSLERRGEVHGYIRRARDKTAESTCDRIPALLVCSLLTQLHLEALREIELIIPEISL
jgi:hypothetical protein